MTDLTVNVSKIIHAPIDRVFDAWLEAETLARFILPMPGMPHPETQTDARVGSGFTIIMQVGDNKIPHTGKYLEITRPNKLVFTWESPSSTQGSTVTLLFRDLGDNTTHVDLNHIKFIDEETRANHEGGWGNILNSLDDVLK